MTFKNKLATSQDEKTLDLTSKSLYIMSKASQNVWAHRIDPNIDSSTDVVRYSITLRSIIKNGSNSTIILGDSNTGCLHFGSAKGTFGAKMPGKRLEAYHIGDIDPIKCMGYENVIIHVGINDLRENSPGRKPEDPAPDDIRAHFDRLTRKLELIQSYCPKSRLIVSPLLPTKLAKYNSRAMALNRLLLNYVTSTNTGIRLLDVEDFRSEQTGLLRDELGRYFTPHDPLHLGKLGFRILAQLFIAAVFRPKSDVRLYSSVLNHESVPRGWAPS